MAAIQSPSLGDAERGKAEAAVAAMLDETLLATLRARLSEPHFLRYLYAAQELRDLLAAPPVMPQQPVPDYYPDGFPARDTTAAYGELLEFLVDAAVRAHVEIAGWLSEGLEAVARRLPGRSAGLVRQRPGSWEAVHVRALAAGADFTEWDPAPAGGGLDDA